LTRSSGAVTPDRETILLALGESYRGPAWHGPSVREALLALLDRYHKTLIDAIDRATPEQLARVPAGAESMAHQLLGMALHDTYHAGQIRLLALEFASVEESA